MTTIVTRSGKGSPLENSEVDANFTNLNTDKVEKSGDSMTGNLSFGDNDKAIFGASSDLQIYHDGSNSVIADFGTGSLFLAGTDMFIQNASNENYITCNSDSTVKLYYDNAEKLATTSTGIDVTGTVTADGLTVDAASVVAVRNAGTAELKIHGNVNSSAAVPTLSFIRGTGEYAFADAYTDHQLYSAGGSLYIKSGASGSSQLNAFFSTGGDVGFYDPTGANASFVYDASSQLVVNEDSRDFDFRVESDTNTHALFVDASNSYVGINTTPNTIFEVTNPTKATDTVNTLLTQRWSRKQTGAVKWGNSIDLLLGSYESGTINSRTRVDFQLADGATDTPDTTVMTLQGNGNVGIGVSNPSNLLTLGAAGGPTMRLSDNTSGVFGIVTSGSNGDLTFSADHGDTGSATDIIFKSDGGTERMRIYSDGVIKAQNTIRSAGQIRATGWFGSAAADSLGLGVEMGMSGGQGYILVYNRSDNTYGNLSFNVDQSISLDPIYDGGEIRINDTSKDTAFRVESDSKTHALYVDGGTGYVGINQSNPAADLHIARVGEATLMLSDLDGTNYNASIGSNGGSFNFVSRSGSSNGQFTFYGYDGTGFDTHTLLDTITLTTSTYSNGWCTVGMLTSVGGSYMQIKTNIYRSSKMYYMHLIGAGGYNGENTDTILTGYAYAPRIGVQDSGFHGYTNNGSHGIVDVYYSSDDYMCIILDGQNNYGQYRYTLGSHASGYANSSRPRVTGYVGTSTTTRYY